MKEYEYRWDREFAVTRVCFSLTGWGALFGFPAVFVWMATLSTPGREWQVLAGYVGLTAACTALHSRKYWKRLSDRSPQLEFRRDGLRAVQLDGKKLPYHQEIPWSEVLRMRGVEEVTARDLSTLTLVTLRGPVTLDISGLDASMHTILATAEAAALASGDTAPE